MEADMRSWGAPESEIERWKRESGVQSTGDVIALPLYCRRPVQIFSAVSTQWNKLLAGDRLLATGLNYAGVAVALRALRIRFTPAVFADLQLMEDEALIAMSEKA